MAAVVNNKILLYADDTGILVSGNSTAEIESILSGDLELISGWLVDNKLSLHLGKTETILFGSKPKIRSNPNLNVSCNEVNITSTSSVKYLGAIMDQCLSGESIATSVINKANSRLKFLYRKSKFLTMHTRKLLVMSLIQCHFDYACSSWYPGLTMLLKKKLQIIQNKMIRFVLKMDNRSHIGKEQYIYLGWLPVSKRVELIILCHVHKIKYGFAPEYLGEHFKSLNSVNSRCTRSNKIASNESDYFSTNFTFNDTDRFSKPRVGSFTSKTFSINGIDLWNSLPQNIRDISKPNLFKCAIRQYLLHQ